MRAVLRSRKTLQIGKAAELRFCSLVMLGSGGLVEIVPPLADDERRDFELHLRHRFGRALSIQVRTNTKLFRRKYLHLAVRSRKGGPIDRAYWFFVAYFDLKTLDFGEPMFLIPSRALRERGRLLKMVHASMRSADCDRWARYRVTRPELGNRLLEELKRLPTAKRHKEPSRRTVLTETAEGIAGQLLVAAAAMLGSHGVVKAGFPVVDDEGRDVELHLGGEFPGTFAVQVKTTIRLYRAGQRWVMRVRVWLLPENVISHGCYWYLFAYVDRSLTSLGPYLFLVPSPVVHDRLRKRGAGGLRSLSFAASMEPQSHDQWARYRLTPGELGERLVELMRQAPKGLAETDTLAALRKIPGICMFGTQPPSKAV